MRVGVAAEAHEAGSLQVGAPGSRLQQAGTLAPGIQRGQVEDHIDVVLPGRHLLIHCIQPVNPSGFHHRVMLNTLQVCGFSKNGRKQESKDESHVRR